MKPYSLPESRMAWRTSSRPRDMSMMGRETSVVAGWSRSAGNRKESGIDDACTGVRFITFAMDDPRELVS